MKEKVIVKLRVLWKTQKVIVKMCHVTDPANFGFSRVIGFAELIQSVSRMFLAMIGIAVIGSSGSTDY